MKVLTETEKLATEHTRHPEPSHNPIYEGLISETSFNAKHQFLGKHREHLFRHQLITDDFLSKRMVASVPNYDHTLDIHGHYGTSRRNTTGTEVTYLTMRETPGLDNCPSLRPLVEHVDQQVKPIVTRLKKLYNIINK